MHWHATARARWAAEGLAAALQRGAAADTRVSVLEWLAPLPVPAPDALVALVDDASAALALLALLPPSLPVLLLCAQPALLADLAGAHTRPLGLLQANVDDTRLHAAAQAVALGLHVRESGPASGSASFVQFAQEVLEPLTPRESEVLELMAKGLGNRDIALALGVSHHTAKFHVAQILDKTGTATRTEAVRQGLRLGLVGL